MSWMEREIKKIKEEDLENKRGEQQEREKILSKLNPDSPESIFLEKYKFEEIFFDLKGYWEEGEFVKGIGIDEKIYMGWRFAFNNYAKDTHTCVEVGSPPKVERTNNGEILKDYLKVKRINKGEKFEDFIEVRLSYKPEEWRYLPGRSWSSRSNYSRSSDRKLVLFGHPNLILSSNIPSESGIFPINSKLKSSRDYITLTREGVEPRSGSPGEKIDTNDIEGVRSAVQRYLAKDYLKRKEAKALPSDIKMFFDIKKIFGGK